MFGGMALLLSLNVLFLFVGLVCWFFEWTCLIDRFVFFNHLAPVMYFFWFIHVALAIALSFSFGCLVCWVLGWICLLCSF